MIRGTIYPALNRFKMQNTEPLIFIQHPQPRPEQIIAVINQEIKEEEDYAKKHETSFRLVLLKKLINNIEKIR